jgi:Cysteine-rich secretory protein family
MKQAIKKVFYPHHKHNPRPLFWHPVSVSLFALGILFISGFVTLQNLEVKPESLLGDIRSGALISFTNKERTRNGLPTLIESQVLTKAAQLKADDMVQNGYFAHYSPTNVSPWYWFTQAGYNYQKAGENLAVNFTESKDVVDAWMNSPTHRANIVKDGYTEIGVASAEGIYKGKKATFIVQLFASPKIESSSGLAFTIEKKIPGTIGEQSLVRGAEVTVFSSENILQLLASQTYLPIMLLTIFSLVTLVALIVVFTRGKRHTKQFYISIIILFLSLCISIITEINFLRDISIAFV